MQLELNELWNMRWTRHMRNRPNKLLVYLHPEEEKEEEEEKKRFNEIF